MHTGGLCGDWRFAQLVTEMQIGGFDRDPVLGVSLLLVHNSDEGTDQQCARRDCTEHRRDQCGRLRPQEKYDGSGLLVPLAPTFLRFGNKPNVKYVVEGANSSLHRQDASTSKKCSTRQALAVRWRRD